MAIISPNNNKMPKVLAVLSLAIIVGSLYLYKTRNSGEAGVVYEMTNAVVREVDSEKIIAEGIVRSTKGEEVQFGRVITFSINSKTVFKKNSYIATPEQLKSGKQFIPETRIEDGEPSGVKAGTIFSRLIKPRLSR